MTDLQDSSQARPVQLFALSWPKSISAKTIHIFDVTSSLAAVETQGPESFEVADTASSSPLAALTGSIAEVRSRSSPDPRERAVFTLTSSSWKNSKMRIEDGAGKELGVWEAPWLAFGTSKLVFPESSDEHDLSEIKPLGLHKLGVGFVKSSVAYAWEGVGDIKGQGRQCLSFRKTIAGCQSEIGFCYQRHGYDHSAVVAVDKREMDVLIGLVTCIAVLERRDSFSK